MIDNADIWFSDGYGSPFLRMVCPRGLFLASLPL